MNLKQLEVWFVTGSQHLYGPETLKQVAANSQHIAPGLWQAPAIPMSVVFKPVVKTPAEATEFARKPTRRRTALG